MAGVVGPLESQANKGVASGYCDLDSSTLIPLSRLTGRGILAVNGGQEVVTGPGGVIGGNTGTSFTWNIGTANWMDCTPNVTATTCTISGFTASSGCSGVMFLRPTASGTLTIVVAGGTVSPSTVTYSSGVPITVTVASDDGGVTVVTAAPVTSVFPSVGNVAAAATKEIGFRRSGDTNDRFQIDSDGTYYASDGTYGPNSVFTLTGANGGSILIGHSGNFRGLQIVPSDPGYANGTALIVKCLADASTWPSLLVINGGTAGGDNIQCLDSSLNPLFSVLAGGSLDVKKVGAGLRVAEGSNAKQGTATLSAGSVVVSNTSVTATSRILVTSQADGGTPGFLRVSARTAGTSFTITASSGTDTSTVAWEMFEVG